MKKQAQLVLVILIAVLFLFFIQNWQVWVRDTLNVGLSLTAIFIGIVIFLENRHPSKTITWLMVLAVFPVAGFIFYMFFGQSYRKRRLFRKRTFIDEHHILSDNLNRSLTLDELQRVGEHQYSLMKLAHRLGQHPVSFKTETEILTNGDATFREIIQAIKSAKHHIHLEYYIIRHDEIGTEIKELLIQKVKEGVEVRLLYDAVGSWKLSKKFVNELKRAGVEVMVFFPVRIPMINHKINFRNHRKIVIIDGSIGFIGGLNIGDEYLGKSRSLGFWRDTHLKVTGEAVRSLQLIFMQDWFYTTGITLDSPLYLQVTPIESTPSGAAQMVPGGPDSEWEVIKSLFFSMITSARHSIWIASPYFIPDEDMLSALRIAALSGIDVKLLVPSRPDKRIVFYASHSYFPELLEAGVKIFEYQNGFLHSKVVIVDHELASIGTSNMDMRSFHLNFEVNAFLYRTESTMKLVADYIDDLQYAKEIDKDKFSHRSIVTRVVESTSRLLSPLL